MYYGHLQKTCTEPLSITQALTCHISGRVTNSHKDLYNDSRMYELNHVGFDLLQSVVVLLGYSNFLNTSNVNFLICKFIILS